MKVLFIWLNDSGEGTAPIGICSIGAHLKRNGHESDLFDTTFYRYQKSVMREYREKIGIIKKADLKKYGVIHEIVNIPQKFQEKIDTYKPQLIAFSSNSYAFRLGIELLQQVDVHGIPVIFGGPHTTADPDEAIAHKEVDYICVGEGEEAMTELCTRLEQGEDTTNIKNIWTKKDNTVFKNVLRNPVNLDQIPLPDYSIISDKHFYKPYTGNVYRIGFIEATRGCPNSCTYCMAKKYKDIYKNRFFRRKSISRVIEELLYLKNEYKVEMIRFWDETFLSTPVGRLKKLAKRYKNEIALPFLIGTRPETVNQETVDIIKDMGCVSVSVGIESGNEQLRREMLNRKYTNKEVINAFELTRKAGLRRSAFVIIGIPGETEENIFETIQLCKRVKADSIGISYLMPYPGTKMRDHCIEKGYLDKVAKIIDKSDGSILKLPTLSSEALKGLFETFYLYMKAPKWLYPIIEMCEKKECDTEKLFDIMIAHFRKKQL